MRTWFAFLLLWMVLPQVSTAVVAFPWQEEPKKQSAARGGILQDKDAKERRASKEIGKLSGVWVCIGYERDGEAHLDPQAREAMWNETLWFHGGTPDNDPLNISWERKGKQTSALAAITLRPATSLMQLT